MRPARCLLESMDAVRTSRSPAGALAELLMFSKIQHEHKQEEEEGEEEPWISSFDTCSSISLMYPVVIDEEQMSIEAEGCDDKRFLRLATLLWWMCF